VSTSSTFASLGVPDDLVAVLAARDITTPFPVQAATIPDALAGRDVCGKAATGSGKTLAFGLPLLARIERAKPFRPRALVLAPTRELAAQIQRELAPLAAVRNLRVASVYGGVGYGEQRKALRLGTDVLIACPGRLADLLEQRACTLDAIEVVVVDEADQMADMGFLPQVKRLLDLTPTNRQTMLFSATLDGQIAVLTQRYQRDPVHHEAVALERTAPEARHAFWRVEQPDRSQHAAEVIRVAGPTIVFCRTRHGADRVTKQLEKAGVAAAAIHGGRAQNQRDRALAAFVGGSVSALVATDVAARGIHVDDVACVIHFDPPADAKTYLHRSGRTARAGATGVVVSFVGHDQVRDAEAMQRAVGLPAEVGAPVPGQLDTVGAVPNPDLVGTLAPSGGGGQGRGNGGGRGGNGGGRGGGRGGNGGGGRPHGGSGGGSSAAPSDPASQARRRRRRSGGGAGRPANV
jgi:superfamily II DNA/RNA helicase